ncbi:hypothetical protein DFH28DRAFT_1171982, partial [Melampsora americana]
MLLKKIADRLKSIPAIWENLQVEDLVKFCLVGSDLIKRAGRGLSLTEKDVPMDYLHAALDEQIPHFALAQMWVTTFPCLEHCHLNPVNIVEMLGLKGPHQIPHEFFFPPTEVCLMCKKQLPFKKDKVIDGYLYDVDGVHPIKSISMHCAGKRCKITFRPSYFSHGKTRYFYTPEQKRNQDIFQVHQHYFMSKRLADSLSLLQMLSHVSIFNLVNHYNHTHKTFKAPKFRKNQSFGASMSQAVCSDGLDIHHLLYHFDSRKKVLEVP